MSSQPREAGGVLSFTFLDVLTCTMGSLVLLVVVLGDRAADMRLEDALRNGPKRAESAAAPTRQQGQNPMDGGDQPQLPAEQVAARLSQLQKQREHLAKLQKLAAERAAEEQARVAHLEEHQRRLEHELAQLHITLQRLEEAESEQNVDQATAEESLKRLKELIADTEKQIKELQSEPAGKKSYAIVPYDGKNGTHRRPIYVECTADAVIIQPEGIKLTAWDFKGPIRSGNPLASAIRAAREELNQRAQSAGEPELPDAYPLILVRPDAARTYRAVVMAIESWDVQYGYELIEADWELEFPEPDPRLTQVMVHAVEQARERQALLAKAAPRTYSAVPMGGGSESFSEGTGSGAGMGGSMMVNRSPRGESITTLQTPGEEFAGETQTHPSKMSFADEVATSGQAEARHGQVASGADGRQAAPNQYAAAGGGGTSSMETDTPSTTSQAQPLTSLPPGAASASGGGMSAPQPLDVHKLDTAQGGVQPQTSANSLQAVDQSQAPTTESAAATRGANWANLAATQRAAPITRPIKVVVRPEQLDIVAESDAASAQPDVIAFDKPTSEVLDDLAASVKDHIESWGLAGKAMYWRPMLVLHVAPGAEQHAIRLRDLLRDSGVDVRFQDVQTAARPSQEAPSATR